jgi:MFS family permease
VNGPHAASGEGGPIELGPVPWTTLVTIFGLGMAASFVLWPPTFQFGVILDEKALGSAFLTGLTTAVLAAGAVVGALGFTLLRRLSPRTQMSMTFAVGAAGTLLVAQATRLPSIMIGAAIVGVSQGMTTPILSEWMLDSTPFRLRGRVVGTFQTTVFIAQFSGPLLARWIAERSASTVASMLYYETAAVGFAILVAVVARPIPAWSQRLGG